MPQPYNLDLQQINKESTHILAESFSCIDLIFMSHQNLVMESGVQSKFSPSNSKCKV